MKKTFYLVFSIITLLCAELKAQTHYNTDESIRSQIINNKVPGAVYAPASVSNTTVNKGFEGSSLAKALREGKVDGMQFNLSAPAKPTKPVTNAAAKPGNLPSDISASEAKTAHDKALKETTSNTTAPNLTQE